MGLENLLVRKVPVGFLVSKEIENLTQAQRNINLLEGHWFLWYETRDWTQERKGLGTQRRMNSWEHSWAPSTTQGWSLFLLPLTAMPLSIYHRTTDHCPLLWGSGMFSGYLSNLTLCSPRIKGTVREHLIGWVQVTSWTSTSWGWCWWGGVVWGWGEHEIRRGVFSFSTRFIYLFISQWQEGSLLPSLPG